MAGDLLITGLNFNSFLLGSPSASPASRRAWVPVPPVGVETRSVRRVAVDRGDVAPTVKHGPSALWRWTTVVARSWRGRGAVMAR